MNWPWQRKQCAEERARIEMHNAKVIAEAALALPCSLFHAPGAECADCNPQYVGGFTASPSFLRERLDFVRDAIGQ